MIVITWALKRYQYEKQTSEHFSTAGRSVKSGLVCFIGREAPLMTDEAPGCRCCYFNLDLGRYTVAELRCCLPIVSDAKEMKGSAYSNEEQWRFWSFLVCCWCNCADYPVRNCRH